MQLIATGTTLNFMKGRLIAAAFSALLILASIGSFAVNGINWGLDFTGGTLIELGYQQPVNLNKVRGQLEAIGYPNANVKFFGTSQEITVRLPNTDSKNNVEISTKVISALQSDTNPVEMRQINFVGPSVGEELTNEGGMAMIIALICIMVYVTIRFEWKFAVGSVAALAHDVCIVIGFFSMTQIEFDLTILAAVLAVIGYSLNDTIVVFDRIRENFLKLRKADSIEVTNTSLNQTLSRTLMTSLTTLLVLLALFFVGGAMIHGFATALIVGVLIGTYSSIYVASTSVIALGITKEDLMPIEVDKEGEDTEANHPYKDL